jgi:hypothetical protein
MGIMLLMTEKSILAGHKWVVALIILGSIIALWSFLIDMARDQAPIALIRTGFTAFLYWSMYYGKGWARWLAMFANTVTGFLFFRNGLTLLQVSTQGAGIFISIGLFYWICAGLLLIKPVDDYYAYTAKL